VCQAQFKNFIYVDSFNSKDSLSMPLLSTRRLRYRRLTDSYKMEEPGFKCRQSDPKVHAVHQYTGQGTNCGVV
jgi:hypothetical protein